jgi:hypothetical protein
VDRFVATGSIEKGKSVGRLPVNDEIVENLRQRTNKTQKTNPSGSYHFRLMYLPLSTCQKIVRKNLNFYSNKITLQEFQPGDSERRLECCRLLDQCFFWTMEYAVQKIHMHL